VLKEPRSNAAAMSLHQRIRYDIESKILSGKWPPGHRIPKEYALMEQYDCSRMTVNKVLSALAEAGFVERRRRAGSFVARSSVQSAILEIRDIKSEVTARGETYDYELIHRRRRSATRGDQERLGIAKGNDVLVVMARHFANGRPFTIEDRMLNLAAVPEAAHEDFSKISPNTWLLDEVPWTEAEHHIMAINADAVAAELLGIPIGTASLVIHRRTWRSGQLVTFVRLTFPGALYSLFAQFTPARR
jgi:GntR family histidine utilization transcriptional repressor